MDKVVLWQSILDKIKAELNSLSFQTWFEETELYKIENGVAQIIVPYAIHKQHLALKYKDIIDKCFQEVTNSSYELEFLLKSEIEEEKESTEIVEKFKTEEKTVT